MSTLPSASSVRPPIPTPTVDAHILPAERHSFGRKAPFRQIDVHSAERHSFCSIGISAEMTFKEVLSFGFLQKERISISVAH